jgi:hypothetical protein
MDGSTPEANARIVRLAMALQTEVSWTDGAGTFRKYRPGNSRESGSSVMSTKLSC